MKAQIAFLLALFILLASGCGMRTYGKMTCDGKCELIIDREVKELDPVPSLPLPKPDSK